MKRPAITPAMRLAVLKAHGATVMCSECGKLVPVTEVQIDHHLALVDGGAHDVANLRPLCPCCHKFKSAREHIANCKAKRIQKMHEEHVAIVLGEAERPPSKIKSRPFQGSRKFNGKINWRDSK